MEKPIVAITMGDPAGIGPEISLLAASNATVQEWTRPVIIGDANRIERAKLILNQKGRFKKQAPALSVIQDIDAAAFQPGTIDVLDMNNVPADLPWGQVNATAGQCCFDYVKRSVELALTKSVDAICTAPINKEAWKLAHVPYPGHTEALAELSNSASSAMMLVNGRLRVVHVTTHVSLKHAIEMATVERILSRIILTADSLKQFGIEKPRIAVAGINPHAGEHGLFGDEDEVHTLPAIKQAREKGLDVTGPLPPDSVFARAAGGEFDAVIAMYHDQGHIAIKMLGFDTGINVTLGLPILRTSVDHGTAFDIAGLGIARETSMIASIQVAADFLSGNAKQA
jgi:4-phospho-D-threonate 3-dehydrogenase / 4-phospho-D-erythronate 3-dehydrogenase